MGSCPTCELLRREFSAAIDREVQCRGLALFREKTEHIKAALEATRQHRQRKQQELEFHERFHAGSPERHDET